MALVTIWSNVSVFVQTVLDTAVAITSISKASAAVVVAANTLADGDEVVITCRGMSALDQTVARVANVSPTQFELENVDTTAYDTFTSGTFSKITFGAAADTFTDVNATGGAAAPIDVGTIHLGRGRTIPGDEAAIEYSFSSLWDVTDPALIELKKATRAKSRRAIRLGFATGSKLYFNAYPSAPLVATGTKGQAVTTPVTFNVQGDVTAYAS